MVQHYINNGHTDIRTHVNVDPVIKTKHLEIAERVLKSFQDQITYEIVAFPQHGLLAHEDMPSLLREALESGATKLGRLDPAGIDKNIGEFFTSHYEYC